MGKGCWLDPCETKGVKPEVVIAVVPMARRCSSIVREHVAIAQEAAWNEERQPRLGDRFVRKASAAIDGLAPNPLSACR